ncbi:hypothetical protein EDB83DRAFT_2384382 [Lactarius deliciosus]|nr:hypothetical protein EDB83DRAFT_2384382 [Lactarius deliciosus]
MLTRRSYNTLLHLLKSTLTSRLRALLWLLIWLRSKSHLHRKDRWFALFWEPIFPCKFIFIARLTRKDKCAYCRMVQESY